MPPPNAPPAESPAPAFNPGVDFAHGTRGILVFAGTQATEGQIQALDSRLRGMGWARPSYHVCAETADWEHTPWADGPPAFSRENFENLERFLQVTAELGSQVLLDGVCTIRDTASFDRIVKFTEKVGVIAAPFDHVAMHIATVESCTFDGSGSSSDHPGIVNRSRLMGLRVIQSSAVNAMTVPTMISAWLIRPSDARSCRMIAPTPLKLPSSTGSSSGCHSLSSS